VGVGFGGVQARWFEIAWMARRATRTTDMTQEGNDFVEEEKCRGGFKTPKGIYMVISEAQRFHV
jgi:hypothetical protein